MTYVLSCADCRSEIRFAMSPKLSGGQAHLGYKARAVGRVKGAAGRQPETESLFIFHCYDTLGVFLRREKQLIVPNMSIALSVQLTFLLGEGR
jgi:hypothetical protein